MIKLLTMAACGLGLAVPGVTNVFVSFEDKTAMVTYDDSKAQVDALVRATTNAGYPSAPKS